MKRLNGKTALITGGSSGIGLATAKLFAEEGARVTVWARETEERLAQAETEIGHGARAVRVDVTNEEEVTRAAAALDRADVLVNCAGIFTEGSVGETDFVTWKKVLDVNLNGMFLCMKAVLPLMERQNKGAIVNISSEAGIAAIAGQTAYNVSKAAVNMLTKSAARDYALRGIRVNCVCPGRVRTPLVEQIVRESENPKETLEALSHDRPVMRMGDPREIACACLAFATDEMSYATGSVLAVDGGYTL